jgi:hypothetical protein
VLEPSFRQHDEDDNQNHAVIIHRNFILDVGDDAFAICSCIGLIRSFSLYPSVIYNEKSARFVG